MGARRGEGLSARRPRGPPPPSSQVTVRVGMETPCGMGAEPGRATRTNPSTGLRAPLPVTVDHCPVAGAPPTPGCGPTSAMGGRGLDGLPGSPGVGWNTETSGDPGLLTPVVAPEEGRQAPECPQNTLVSPKQGVGSSSHPDRQPNLQWELRGCWVWHLDEPQDRQGSHEGRDLGVLFINIPPAPSTV